MCMYWPDALIFFFVLLCFDPYSMTGPGVLLYMALQRHSGGALNLNVNLTLASLVELQAVLTGEA